MTTPDSTKRQPKVLVFTTPTCPWCVRVKRYLTEQKITFREVDVSRDQAAARDLVRRTGQMGVPVVEIDGRPALIVSSDDGLEAWKVE